MKVIPLVTRYAQFTDNTIIAQHRILNFKNTDWSQVDSRFNVSKSQAFELMIYQLVDFIGLDSTESLVTRSGLRTLFKKIKPMVAA